MLAGEGAIAIWNGISDEGRADFYAWHLSEHMPERVGIPGFLRGRRYRAADDKTHPEFFTLYETQTFEVTQGVDYLNRLNAPTSWTRRATAHFKTTSRSLARVVASFGVGSGGVLLTLRFDVPDEESEREKLASIVMKVAALRGSRARMFSKGMTKPPAPRLRRARIARISSNPPAGSFSSRRVRSRRWRAHVRCWTIIPPCAKQALVSIFMNIPG